MKSVKYEQGYALVTVLLIVTVFMVLFLAFMGQAFSSVKQNQVVEKKSQTVAAAEMGISYYQVATQHTFETKQQVVSDYIKANSSLITNFKRAAAIKMAAELQNAFPIGTVQSPVPIEGLANASFFIKNFVAVADPVPTSHKVNLSFYVVGKENMKESSLFTKMTIDLDSIINIATVDESNNYALPTFNSVIKPPEGCQTLDCDNVYINGNGRFSGNNNIKDNQTIYTTGLLLFDGNGNENNKTNVKIHSDGAITISKNMNSAANVIIETKDEAKFMQNVKISGTSKLLVNKTLSVDQNLEIANNSFVYVGGTGTPIDNISKIATIDNNLNILSSSKMCVNGNLAAKKIAVDSSSKLYVLGKVWESGTVISNYTVTSAVFTKECGTQIPPEFKIKWGDNVNTVINDVDYN
jgi:competence protein ComGC